jgi:hypothetical protein
MREAASCPPMLAGTPSTVTKAAIAGALQTEPFPSRDELNARNGTIHARSANSSHVCAP